MTADSPTPPRVLDTLVIRFTEQFAAAVASIDQGSPARVEIRRLLLWLLREAG